MTARTKAEPRPSALGAGLIALDLVLSADTDVPPRWYAGGTCGNVMAILSYLGWDTYPISRLNDDPAASYLRHDLRHWGVHDDFLSIDAEAETPIIVQQIKRKNGKTSHRFSWQCPSCGRYLPSFRAPTMKAVNAFVERLAGHSVYFFDRVSPATVLLAEKCAAAGALVFFEPNGVTTPSLLSRALAVAHVVKYSKNRVKDLPMRKQPLLEIKTMGNEGLEFRSAGSRKWTRMAAVRTLIVKDTCGAGDWCSAGVLSKLGPNPLHHLISLNRDGVIDAIRFGQALAAWNCAFEGARGAMYHVDSPADAIRDVGQLLEGRVPEQPTRTNSFLQINNFERHCMSCFAPNLAV